MFDGIKFFYEIIDFEAWKASVKTRLYISVEKDTGEIKRKKRAFSGVTKITTTYRGSFETYRITVKETQNETNSGTQSTSYLMILEGSLHKNYFKKHNYKPFSFYDLQLELEHLGQNLQLDLEKAILVNIEFGLNLKLPFPVFDYLQQCLISYKGHSFNKYEPDKNGICIGYTCPLSQYIVKAYDKAKQFGLLYNLMRFELRFLKMQKLNHFDIKTLFDLTDPSKVYNLIILLLKAWDDLLLFENSLRRKNTTLKPEQRELLQQGCNPKFWEQLKEENKRAFNYERAKFRTIIATHGKNVQKSIRDQIQTEWKELFQNCTNLQLR